MSWPTPTTGPWNPGIPPPMPMQTMNMGSYTPQQWTAMQQNWGQWAQWQQQYAQWQSQYGNEYAQQVQAFQHMGGMLPPPPTQMAPPIPPPPDKPPPPPHENNEPLFGNMQPSTSLLPVPVPAPPQSQQNKHSYNNTVVPAGNNQNLSNVAEKKREGQFKINESALKKLAEEEKLFDIQFKKWEEEIGQWRKDNANHPDKQAYKEYEEKFETCRAQLLERRKQMKQKRDALLGIPQQENKATTSNIIATSTLTPTQDSSINYNKNTQLNNYRNTYTSEKAPQFNNYDRTYGGKDNKNVDPQDRYESYNNVNDNYTPPSSSDNANFLEKKNAGIPGLDLIPNIDNASTKNTEFIDISEDQPNNQQHSAAMIRQQKQSHLGPDYTTISKGIDNILGDEKIMNILTMVKGQNSASEQNSPDHRNKNISYNSDYPGQSMNSHNQPRNNQWNRNDSNYNNQQHDGNKQNMRGGRPDYPMQQEQQRIFSNQQRRINDGPGNVPLENINPQNVLMGRQQPQPLMSQNIHPNQLRRMNEGGPGNMPQDNRNPQNTGRPQIQPLMSQNIVPPRPIQQNAPQDYGDLNRGSSDNKILGESNIPNVPLIPPQPQKPKWVDEPMFTPYIIVEYDHKPLRLKARDFIEPVHVFDYNHKSKEEDTKKKDFEEEVDKLFSRHPRKEKGDDDRYDRGPPRDYEWRGQKDTRDDCYPRGNSRNEYEKRRPDRYDDRRRDERERYRSELPLREREYYRGERELPRERERDFTRDRESMRDRERGSIRDRGREREFSRDRERDSARDRERGYTRDREREFTRDRDKDSGRDKEKESIKDSNYSRDRFSRDGKRDERDRSARSQDIDSRKRGLSKESDLSDHSASKRIRDNMATGQVPHIMIDDLLEPPGRDMRPEKIAIILRGPPGSGKSYLAKLIRDREAEYDGTARIMSIDDYFMQESTVEEKDPVTGKITTKPILKYEYDINMEESYLASLRKSFKRSLTNGYFTFLIFDAVNDQLKHYADIWNTARQNGFQVYVCTMELDPHICHKRNIHNRTLEDIQVICCRFFETPAHHLQLDPTTLLQNAAIQNVDMEDAVMEDTDNDVANVKDVAAEVENSFTSKWEKMDDVDKLARLDGTSKPLRPSQLSMEDYLQLDDWKPAVAQPGKKTVRWADIEETREQEKMRAIGFVVGQTDWNRMTDPTMGSRALTQTKYIERVRRH